MENINNKNLNTKKMDRMELNHGMITNAIENGLLKELEKQQTKREHSYTDDAMRTKVVQRKMDNKQKEEIRKTLGIDSRLQFEFVKELKLWIIGGYGPVDIQEELSKRLLPIPDYSKVKEYFQPYLTKDDASEGYSVSKFKMAFWDGGRDLLDEDIYFIQCTNNGISYFACSNLDALRLFVLYG